MLLLGLRKDFIADFTRQLGMPDVQLLGGTGLDDVKSALAKSRIDHVVMGGGLDLETRLAITRKIFQSSDVTTIHLKDQASGPEGFVPFARSVLLGLRDFEIVPSANARSEIRGKKSKTGDTRKSS